MNLKNQILFMCAFFASVFTVPAHAVKCEYIYNYGCSVVSSPNSAGIFQAKVEYNCQTMAYVKTEYNDLCKASFVPTSSESLKIVTKLQPSGRIEYRATYACQEVGYPASYAGVYLTSWFFTIDYVYQSSALANQCSLPTSTTIAADRVW
ncbi:MAG: hypothetical protein AB7F86_09485 [Bdellovibrionales bacterium]